MFPVHLFNVRNFDKKHRYGVQSDGGYVIADLDTGYDCYISAGVGIEESFSRDFLDKHKLQKSDCYAFDGTIQDYPCQYSTDIIFIKKNIGSRNSDEETNLSFLTERYNDIFLKMDIEGGEYTWLSSLNHETLLKFKQIVIEFHGIVDNDWGANVADKIKCFEKLSESHFIIHAHGNNNAGISQVEYNNGCEVLLPQVIELTYVRKNYFDTVPFLNTKCLPDPEHDFRNTTVHNEIDLNHPPFVV
jgi:hypothetical protein